MRRFIWFWWMCAKRAFWGNAAFANDWQWLIGYPATAVLLWLLAYSYAEWSGRIEVTLTTAGLGALAAAGVAFFVTWLARFIARLCNGPVELYFEQKERADKLEGLRKLATDVSRSPSFDLGFEFRQYEPEKYRIESYVHHPLCRIWVENLEHRALAGCRVVLESFGGVSSVDSGVLLVPDQNLPDDNRSAEFHLAATERRYFKFLQLEQPLWAGRDIEDADSWRISVETDHSPTGFAAVFNTRGALPLGNRYFVTIAVHGQNAGSRRINLVIDAKSETDIAISEKLAPVDEIARLRTRETELRNEAVKSDAQFESWKARMNALRDDIACEIAACSSPAQVNRFRTIGNLRHGTPNGIEVFSPEHDTLVRIATRDLDWLDDFIAEKAKA